MRILAACVLSLLLMLPSAARAEGEWVLPRGAETTVLTWLVPLRDEAVVVGDWRLHKIALEEQRLRLCVANPQSAAEFCATLAPSHGQLVLECAADLPPAVCARFHQALDARPLVGSPWREVARGAPMAERPPPWWLLSARLRAGLAWVMWLLGLGAVLVHLPRPWPRPRVLGLLASTCLALVVRVMLSPRTFLHEGYRIDLHTEFLLDGKAWPYGEGLTGPVLLLQRLTGDGITSMFWLDLLLGVLSVPLLIAVAGRFFDWNPGVWAGGVLVALSPLLVRWGACEEPGPLLLLMTSTATLAWCQFLDPQNPRKLPALLLTVASCVLTVHARPEWLPFPLLLLAMPWVLRVPLPRAPKLPLLIALAFGAYAIAPLWLDRRSALLHLPNPQLIAFGHVLALWRYPLTAPGYWLLAFAGAGFALYRHLRPALWLIAARLSMTALALVFFSTEAPYAERMQFVPVAWSALIAGQAIGWLPQRWPAFVRVGLVVVLGTLQLAVCLPEIGRAYTQQSQWRVQQDAARLIPDGARLVARASGSFDHFPRIALQGAGKRVELLDLSLSLAPGAWPSGCNVYVWLGMACWLEPLTEPADLRTPKSTCDSVRQRFALQPVLEAQLTEEGYQPHAHLPMPPGGYRIGLYRVPGQGCR